MNTLGNIYHWSVIVISLLATLFIIGMIVRSILIQQSMLLIPMFIGMIAIIGYCFIAPSVESLKNYRK